MQIYDDLIRIKKTIINTKNRAEKVNLIALYEGMRNFYVQSTKFENIARKRSEVCKNCDFNIKEDNVILAIKDENIKDISERYCSDCGCVLAYKVRQNIKKCKKWAK